MSSVIQSGLNLKLILFVFLCSVSLSTIAHADADQTYETAKKLADTMNSNGQCAQALALVSDCTFSDTATEQNCGPDHGLETFSHNLTKKMLKQTGATTLSNFVSTAAAKLTTPNSQPVFSPEEIEKIQNQLVLGDLTSLKQLLGSRATIEQTNDLTSFHLQTSLNIFGGPHTTALTTALRITLHKNGQLVLVWADFDLLFSTNDSVEFTSVRIKPGGDSENEFVTARTYDAE